MASDKSDPSAAAAELQRRVQARAEAIRKAAKLARHRAELRAKQAAQPTPSPQEKAPQDTAAPRNVEPLLAEDPEQNDALAIQEELEGVLVSLDELLQKLEQQTPEDFMLSNLREEPAPDTRVWMEKLLGLRWAKRSREASAHWVAAGSSPTASDR